MYYGFKKKLDRNYLDFMEVTHLNSYMISIN